jgi:hypothetical protein
VPARALREPALYLSVEVLPMAVVAPFLHPASSFANFRGQHSIPTDSPRLNALLEGHRGRVRTFGRALELIDGKPRADAVIPYDDTLLRIGYRVDTGDCFTIAWQRDADDRLSRLANRLAGDWTPPRAAMLSVVSCALAPVQRDPADIDAEARISALFDRVEKACPGLFRGQTAVTERLGRGWSRNYSGLDARLQVHEGKAALFRYRALVYVDLGTLSDWASGESTRPEGCA